MQASFESNGTTTPEFRAAILGELLHFIALQIEPVPFDKALYHIMKVSDCKEEQVGGEVCRAWFLLDRSGMIKSNTFAAVRAITTAIPSRLVTDYMWEEPVWWSENEEEGA